MTKEQIRMLITSVAGAASIDNQRDEILCCLWDYYDQKCKEEKTYIYPNIKRDQDRTLSGLGTMVCNGEK